MTDELNATQSNANRDIGIAHAVGAAEMKVKDWQNKAINYIYRYPYDSFMTEELRLWSHANGLPHPPNSRAWGGVVKVACKRKIIKHMGYGNVRNKKAHGTPASVWEKC